MILEIFSLEKKGKGFVAHVEITTSRFIVLTKRTEARLYSKEGFVWYFNDSGDEAADWISRRLATAVRSHQARAAVGAAVES